MSLHIEVDEITEVLLVDGWHRVVDKSFDLDSYEFLDGPGTDAFLLHGAGRAGICSTGFRFKGPDGQILAGPLSAILAVRYSA